MQNKSLSFDIKKPSDSLKKKQSPIFSVITLLLVAVIIFGFSFLETERLEAKQSQYLAKGPVRLIEVNDQPTPLHLSSEGEYTARVSYKYCYERGWSEKEICNRKIVRVVFDEELPEPKK